MKKNEKICSVSDSVVKKLNDRLVRDEQRFKNQREVYTYRKDGVCSDNLLLLESSTREVHGEVFKSWYQNFSKEEKERYSGIEVVNVGRWNKLTMKFTPSKDYKVIFKGSQK